MNLRFTIVESSLNRAEFRWKWLRFLQRSLALGAIICLLVLLCGVAILSGWIASKAVALTFFALLAVAGFIAWVIILISVVAGTPERSWLGAALERVDHRLLDRLNTLLFLERRRGDARVESFALRIARQTQGVLAQKQSPSPFSARLPFAYLAGFLVVLTGTVLLYHGYSPWRLLAEQTKAAEPVQPEKALDLALPATNNVEQNQAWGEVRITDPGADLKVTKVDVVPLQIEAAANQSLQKVDWFSTINGDEEQPHELPPPAEPRYAVYQPTVYLDELQLSDWDVMTYYAKANTEKENSFASEVYFLEVRPFREDLLKMPGGAGGKAYECLNELSALIGRQQHVIRQTHQHLQKPPEQENLKQQDRKKLSEAEADLRDSTQHLYAQMASELENKPIGEALDNLAKAEKSLDRSSKLLGDNVMNEAGNRERTAFAELVAARKAFQKSVSENPRAFDEPKEEEPVPVADSTKKLNQMTEFRNEARAAQDFVKKTLAQQKTLEQQAKPVARNDYPLLAAQERQLQKDLEEFEQQHPQVFKGTEAEAQAAGQAMDKAAQALQKKSSDARSATQEASQQLEQFSQAMEGKAVSQQLADAYRLKQMLDQQVQTFDQYAKSEGNLSDADLQKTAREARQTVNQLKNVAEQEPTRDAFGQPLRDALNGANKVDLDAQFNQLVQEQDQTAKKQRAGQTRDSLNKVSQAFAASQPKGLQMARNSDSLKPGEQESFNAGMAQLQSLVTQAQNKHALSSEDQAKQGREALYNLQTGLRSYYGDNERAEQIRARLEDILKADAPLDVEGLKKLMDELQHFSLETSDRLAKKEDKPEVTNIDPTRLPPAYRGRIQKYFQKLSEK